MGGGDRALAAAVLDAVGAGPAVLDELARVPLVDIVDGGCWPHGAWVEATRDDLDPATATTAFAAAADAHRVAARFDQAGALAIESGARDVLARIVRDALDSQPPRVPLPMLERWSESDLLEPSSPEGVWLEGVIAVHGRGSASDARKYFEVARAPRTPRAEMPRVRPPLSCISDRSRGREDDLVLLGELHARSREIESSPRLRSLTALGEAIIAQLSGDSAAAVAILDAAPFGVLTGDWAAQEQMVLGTNLALTGRSEEAVVALGAATGIGSRSGARGRARPPRIRALDARRGRCRDRGRTRCRDARRRKSRRTRHLI